MVVRPLYPTGNEGSAQSRRAPKHPGSDRAREAWAGPSAGRLAMDTTLRLRAASGSYRANMYKRIGPIQSGPGPAAPETGD